MLGHQVECGAPARRIDGGHHDRELVAELDPATRAAAHERDAVLVAVEALARVEAPRGQEALEDVAEAHEEPGADETRDDALEALVPAVAAQPVLQQERQADRLGAPLGIVRPALDLRAAQCGLRELARLRGILAETGERAGRAMHDDVGIAADGRREMDVGGRGKS